MQPQINLLSSNGGTMTLARFESDVTRFLGARSAFGPLLRVPFMFQVATARPDVMILGGTLSWNNEDVGLSIPAQAIHLNKQHLDAPITDEQLNRIEERRAGEAPTFSLKIDGVLFHEGTLTTVSHQPAVPLIIPKEQWLTVLEQVGFGKRRLIELPALQDQWADVAQQLQQASQRLAKGDAGGAMTATRIATERLTEQAGILVGVARASSPTYAAFVTAVAQAFDDRHVKRSDDPNAVVAHSLRLLNAIFGFASNPPHNDLEAADRRDVTLAIGLVTTLLAYLPGAR